jgi:hypothetical protein
MTKTYRFTKPCAECGEPFQTNRRDAEFCGDAHRKAYNNRRAVRGAEMYDLMMTLRFERTHARDEQLWSHLCALASAYKTSDRNLRADRPSYDKNAHKNLPLTYSNTAGDGR